MSRGSAIPEMALLGAARDGVLERVRDLLDCGCNIEHESGDGATALIWAARSGHDHIVKELLDRGALPDHQDNKGETALLAAASSGCINAVKNLLDHGAEINHQNRQGHTALYLAASYPKKREPPNDAMAARHEEHDLVVQELLLRGADTEICEYREFGGRQPVSAAAKTGNVSAVLHLLNAGARFLSDEMVGVDLLNRLASEGRVREILRILERGNDSFDIDEKDNRGMTALAWAVSSRHHDAVLVLLDHGAAASEDDRTAIAEWLQAIEAQADRFHDEMYNTRSTTDAAGSYANAKDCFHDALALARRLHHRDTVARLEGRLNHIKSVFRSQFS
jgi:ankyrin repeat domain-containing protein 50